MTHPTVIESFDMPKLHIARWQVDYVRSLAKGDPDVVEAFIQDHFEIIEPIPLPKMMVADLSRQLFYQLNIDPRLLGSLAHEQQFGMAKDSKVSKLRGLSYGPHSVLIDETCHITEVDSGSAHWSRIPESDTVQLTEWLQRRSVCSRALSCSIP